MKNKIVSGYAVGMCSSFFVGGMIVFYLLAKETEWYLIFGQVAVIGVFLKLAPFVKELISKYTLFYLLFAVCSLLLGGASLFIEAFYGDAFTDLLLVIGCILTMIVFYVFCSPQKLNELGWEITEKY